MIDEWIDGGSRYKIVPITNISGTCLTDINNNKYNREKVKYVWHKGVPIENPEYVGVHLIENTEENIDFYA
jgi:hypothetical protein